MLNLARHEVMYYFKNKIELIELTSFIITVILLLSFGLRSTLTAHAELLLAGFWLALAAATAIGAAGLFERDYQAGRLELYQMLPAGLETLMLGKWLAFYLLLAIPVLITVPIMALVLEQVNSVQWLVGLLIGAVDMSLIACFAGAMLAGGRRGTALLGLIGLPLMVPVVIFGTEYCRQTHLADSALLFLIAYGMLLAPLAMLAAASSVRASH